MRKMEGEIVVSNCSLAKMLSQKFSIRSPETTRSDSDR